MLAVENISSEETTIFENATYHVATTSVLGELLSTPLSKTTKSNENLLFFIKMVGGTDIILLSAYLALCIYDRTGRGKTTEFSSPGQQSSGRSTTYENIEIVSLFSTR